MSTISADICRFVLDNFLFGDAFRLPADEESLIELGVIDSTGVLELIEFLESHFGIAVSDSETVPANLDSLGNLTRFVTAKLNTAGESSSSAGRH